MSAHFEAPFYVQIQAVRDRYGRATGAKAVRLTQARPSDPVPDSVLVKLTARVPRAALEALAEAVVVIPEELAIGTPIEVEASDPRGEQ